MGLVSYHLLNSTNNGWPILKASSSLYNYAKSIDSITLVSVLNKIFTL